MSDYDDDSDGSNDLDESTASESFDDEYGKLEFEEAVRLAKNNKLPKVDYSKLMLELERDSKKLGHDSSDDNNKQDESSNTENDSDRIDDDQYNEYSEEEESISDKDSYKYEDGESEEEFEEITDEEDVDVKKDKKLYKRVDSIPKWIEDLFPEDLTNALEGNFTKPKNRGRTTSINADNVNDLAYYIDKSKKDIDDPLKGTKDVTPFHYSGQNFKFKCHTYISRSYVRDKKAVYSPFKKNIQAPNWYKYLYIFQHVPYTISTDILYDLAYICPNPFEYLKYLIKNLEKGGSPFKLYSRTKKNKEKDLKLYQSLSDQNKDVFVSWIGNKKINFDIKDYLLKEKDYRRIGKMEGYVKLFDYFQKNNQIKEFKKFVDENRKVFKHLRHYKVIKPKFSELYEYAYAETSFRRATSDTNRFDEFFKQLIDKKCYKEVTFIVKKHYIKSKYDEDICIYALKKLDLKLINCFGNSEHIQRAIGQLLYKNDDDAFRLMEAGYFPDPGSVFSLYEKSTLPPFCKNFEVLKLVRAEKELDSMLYYLSHYHSELLEEFISRFRNRIKDLSPKCFSIHTMGDSKHFLKTCEVLGFRPEDFIDNIYWYSMRHAISDRNNTTRMAPFCLEKYPQYVKVTKEHMKYALEEDEITLALLMIRAGGNVYEIKNWQSKCSKKMLKKISNC